MGHRFRPFLADAWELVSAAGKRLLERQERLATAVSLVLVVITALNQRAADLVDSSYKGISPWWALAWVVLLYLVSALRVHIEQVRQLRADLEATRVEPTPQVSFCPPRTTNEPRISMGSKPQIALGCVKNQKTVGGSGAVAEAVVVRLAFEKLDGTPLFHTNGSWYRPSGLSDSGAAREMEPNGIAHEFAVGTRQNGSIYTNGGILRSPARVHVTVEGRNFEAISTRLILSAAASNDGLEIKFEPEADGHEA